MYLYTKLKEQINSGLNPTDSQSEVLLRKLEKELDNAMHNNDYESKLSLNRSLYLLYKLYWSTSGYPNSILEQNIVLYQIRVKIENYLKDYADSKITEQYIRNIPVENDQFVLYIEDVITSHPAYNHVIYEEFIPNQCNLEELRYYFVQETTMDINTDDFLALLQLGCERSVKTEIARNYWDEMGHGKFEKMHGLLFENLFEYLGADPNVEIENITLEALVCGNLQLLVSLYRQYFPHGAGFFYPCERMASGRFQSAIDAWERLELNRKGLIYHKLHVPLDVIHAKNWMNNVLVPFITKKPESKEDILRGILYRLNSSFEYLEMLKDHWNVAMIEKQPS